MRCGSSVQMFRTRPPELQQIIDEQRVERDRLGQSWPHRTPDEPWTEEEFGFLRKCIVEGLGYDDISLLLRRESSDTLRKLRLVLEGRNLNG